MALHEAFQFAQEKNISASLRIIQPNFVPHFPSNAGPTQNPKRRTQSHLNQRLRQMTKRHNKVVSAFFSLTSHKRRKKKKGYNLNFKDKDLIYQVTRLQCPMTGGMHR